METRDEMEARDKMDGVENMKRGDEMEEGDEMERTDEMELADEMGVVDDELLPTVLNVRRVPGKKIGSFVLVSNDNFILHKYKVVKGSF